MDILNPETLHAWLSLRKLATNYGLKYFKRHELFLAANASVAMISIVIFLEIAVFNFIPGTNNNVELDKLAIFCLYISIYLFGLTLALVFWSELINEHFDIHK